MSKHDDESMFAAKQLFDEFLASMGNGEEGKKAKLAVMEELRMIATKQMFANWLQKPENKTLAIGVNRSALFSLFIQLTESMLDFRGTYESCQLVLTDEPTGLSPARSKDLVDGLCEEIKQNIEKSVGLAAKFEAKTK